MTNPRMLRAACGMLALLAALAAAPSQAAEQFWIGTLRFESPGLPPLILSGIGVSTLNGSAGGTTLTSLRIAGGITGSTIAPVTDPSVVDAGLAALALSSGSLGTGTLAPFTPSLAPLTVNRLPVRGVARLCLILASCDSASVDVPLTRNGGNTGIGVGGLLPADQVTPTVSVIGAPWTIATVTLNNETFLGGTSLPTTAGFVHGPASGTTALTSAVLQVVSPTRIETKLPGFPSVTALFVVLRLHFVPEPASFVLLVTGVAGLAALGKQRMRSSRAAEPERQPSDRRPSP